MQLLLTQAGYQVDAAPDRASAARELGSGGYDCALCDAAAVGALAGANPPALKAASIVGIDGGEADGAYDSVARPVSADALAPVLRRVAERASLRRQLAGYAAPAVDDDSDTLPGTFGMVGSSPVMQRVFREMSKVAPYKTNVLITGESGTGKELVARGLHRLSGRASGSFVAINCGAIPSTLLESELFGHCKGAFTDAVRDKRGMFEEANGGTLFLDEIGELPLELQVKLLRVLQEEEIRAVGDDETRAVDVRVVAATVRDLEREIAAGRFREDLYYRLNVLSMRLPPLRERRDDIPPLVAHFVRAYRDKHARAGMRVTRVADEAMALLLDYAWPGNIRELENSIERAMVLCDGEVITADLLEDKLRLPPAPVPSRVDSAELSIKKASRALERELIQRALARTEGNRTAAARLLEISHRALLYKIKEYGI